MNVCLFGNAACDSQNHFNGISPHRNMRIVSWNVNGLRALARKEVFLEFLESSRADVVTLQETRTLPSQLNDEIRQPDGWHSYFSGAERLGYSGVAIYSKKPATKVESKLPEDRFNNEGRFLVARYGRVSIASIYFPNGAGKDRDNSRVPYKLDFYSCAKKELDRMRRYGPVFVTGDFNTAHTEIDLARPKSNQRTTGFLPIERKALDEWTNSGWVDVFRRQHRGEPDHYTWWKQWGGARENNVGWRIDYVLASPSASRQTNNAFIWPHIMGSDHCPVGVDTDIET